MLLYFPSYLVYIFMNIFYLSLHKKVGEKFNFSAKSEPPWPPKKAYKLHMYFFSATDVIAQAVEIQDDLGKKVQEIMLRGEAVPEELAAKLIEEKVNSPEVAHHGKDSNASL